MKPFLSRNIDSAGRLLRGLWAAGMFAAAWYFGVTTWPGIILIAAGGLALVEAVAGWCILRACGVKTKF